MKTKLFVLAASAVISMILPFAAVRSVAAPVEIAALRPTTVPEMIEDIAPRFGQDAELLKKISYCESKWLVAVHDGGYGKGVTGIHSATFAGWLPSYEKNEGETLDYSSQYDQLKMMAWAFSQGESYRTQWTTYVAYQKGGTYSFYSNLLKGHYTVRCK